MRGLLQRVLAGRCGTSYARAETRIALRVIPGRVAQGTRSTSLRQQWAHPPSGLSALQGREAKKEKQQTQQQQLEECRSRESRATPQLRCRPVASVGRRVSPWPQAIGAQHRLARSERSQASPHRGGGRLAAWALVGLECGGPPPHSPTDGNRDQFPPPMSAVSSIGCDHNSGSWSLSQAFDHVFLLRSRGAMSTIWAPDGPA